MGSILIDVGFNKNQWVQEMAALAHQHGYDYRNPDIRQCLWEAFATPLGTKEFMEDTFRDVVGQLSGSRVRANRFRKFRCIVESGEKRCKSC